MCVAACHSDSVPAISFLFHAFAARSENRRPIPAAAVASLAGIHRLTACSLQRSVPIPIPGSTRSRRPYTRPSPRPKGEPLHLRCHLVTRAPVSPVSPSQTHYPPTKLARRIETDIRLSSLAIHPSIHPIHPSNHPTTYHLPPTTLSSPLLLTNYLTRPFPTFCKRHSLFPNPPSFCTASHQIRSSHE